MTTDASVLDPARATTVPVLEPARAIAVAQQLATTFAGEAARRDRDRILPAAEIEELSASGLLSITVPRESGGAGAPASTVAEVIRILATADPNIAQIPQSHFVYLNLLRLAAPPELQAEIHADVLRGARLGNAQSELNGPTALTVTTTLTPDAHGDFRLTGRKGYATGARPVAGSGRPLTDICASGCWRRRTSTRPMRTSRSCGRW